MAFPGGLRTMRAAALMLVAVLLASLAAACGGNGNRGFPKEAGQYDIVKGSLIYDGQRYELAWLDKAGASHQAEGREIRMQKAERTFLEIGQGSPVVNLKEDEAVTVRGRDKDGLFDTPWFPFFLGYALGGAMGNPTSYYPGDRQTGGPGYHYPPSGTFDRGDQLNGSIQRDKSEPPDYKKVQPAPHAVSGQSAGTGGGNAATNKSTAPTGGQSGGTGTGSAASGKSGGFANGGSTSGGGTGVGGGASYGSGSKPSTGSGSNASKPSAPVSPPKLPAPTGRRR
jgi:hypothetical protein